MRSDQIWKISDIQIIHLDKFNRSDEIPIRNFLDWVRVWPYLYHPFSFFFVLLKSFSFTVSSSAKTKKKKIEGKATATWFNTNTIRIVKACIQIFAYPQPIWKLLFCRRFASSMASLSVVSHPHLSRLIRIAPQLNPN